MTSAHSFSNTWIRETIRRNRIIPVVAFIAYFVTAVLPVLMNYNTYESIALYAEETVNSNNFFVGLLDAAFAVAVSAVCFSWLHDRAAVVQVHAMPVTRARLFFSTAASGMIMLMIPLLLTMLCMLCLRGAHPQGSVELDGQDAAALFALVPCLKWLVKQFVIILFVYAVSNLAAVIAGNHVIHVLLACFLNALPMTLFLQFVMCVEEFWYGYSNSEVDELMSRLSPVTGFMMSYETPTPSAMLCGIWVLAAVIISGLSLWIYNKAPLERVHSSCFFPLAGDLISIFLTLIGSCFGAMLLYLVTWNHESNQPLRFMACMLVCSIPVYLICRMIADSSTHVFNVATVRKYGICLVCLLVFCAFAVFDLGGFSGRVPAQDSVSSVTVDDPLLATGIPGSEPELIRDALAFQEAAVASRKDKVDPDASYLPLRYTMKNGAEKARSYPINSGAVREAYGKLLNSAAYKNARREYFMKACKEWNGIELWIYENEQQSMIPKTECTSFTDALLKDLDAMVLPQALEQEDVEYIGDISVELDGSSDMDSISLSIRKDNKHIIAYLKEHGYMNAE